MVLAVCQINAFILKYMLNNFFFPPLNGSEESNPSKYPQTNSGLLVPVFLNSNNHLALCT